MRRASLALTLITALALAACGGSGSTVPSDTWSALAAAWPQGHQQTFVVRVDAGGLVTDLDPLATLAIEHALGLIGVELDDVAQPVVALRIVTPSWRSRALSDIAFSGFVVAGPGRVLVGADGLPSGALWFGPIGERATTARIVLGG